VTGTFKDIEYSSFQISIITRKNIRGQVYTERLLSRIALHFLEEAFRRAWIARHLNRFMGGGLHVLALHQLHSSKGRPQQRRLKWNRERDSAGKNGYSKGRSMERRRKERGFYGKILGRSFI
jgi:hypothetical protein